MRLYPHNQEAVDKVLEAFETKNKVAIVHATGTGKSFCIAAVAEHYDKVLVVAPNNLVLNETRKVCKKGTDFRTYTSLMYDENPPKYDLIVLDEFHRSGAEKWGEGIERLLEANEDSKVFGTSATHIRYLDGERNMADEIFDGNVVSYIGLKDAIERGILPDPIYVSSLYSIEETKKNYISKIEKSRLDVDGKNMQRERLEGITFNWEKANGVPTIIRKYFTKDMKRIIVFCSNVKKVKEMRHTLGQWLVAAGYSRLRFYSIDYKEKRLEKEMADFQEDVEDGTLKVAISVNMLNEGVHIPRVDGVIMLRSTISRIIIEQQIGRCLTANSERTPVVLDLVNNMDSIKYDVFFNMGGGNGESPKGEKDIFPFRIIDECRDLKVFFEQMDREVELCHSWTFEECREEALKYTRKVDFYNHAPNAVAAAQRNGWWGEITSHMKDVFEYWSYDMCLEEAMKCKTIKEFREEHSKANASARHNGWYKDIILKAGLTRAKITWTEQEIRESAKGYKTFAEFKKDHPKEAAYSYKLGISDDLGLEKPRVKWTNEELIELSKKYKRIVDLQNDYPGAYVSIKRNHLEEECFSHMEKRQEVTEEYIRELAKQCKNRKELSRLNSYAHKVAVKTGLINELFGFAKKSRTLEECHEIALRYKTKAEFYEAEHTVYEYCNKKKWLKIVTSHMPYRTK